MKNTLFFFALIFIAGCIEAKNLNSLKMSTVESQINMNEIIKKSLNTHNEYRKRHKAPPLVMDNTMSKMAQTFANTLIKSSKMYHSDDKLNGVKLGENIYKCWGCKLTGKEFVDSWYNEVNKYDWKVGGYQKGCGHFTQVVWKKSQKLGLGVAAGDNRTFIVVANYLPAGNFLSQFAQNVLK